MSMGIFTLALAANEQREAAISGEYFELRNALSPIVLVELLDAMGGVVCRLDNPEQSDFVKPGYFQTVRFTNGPVAQTVRYFYGSGDAGSRRTSGLVQVDGTVKVMGDVSVIDGEKSRTLAGGMFSASINAPIADGLISCCQLFNPVGSGKNVIVSSASFTAAVSQAAILYLTQGVYAVDVSATRISNKLGGGLAVGSAQARIDSAAGLPAVRVMQAFNIAANGYVPWSIRGAVVLPPSWGLAVFGNTPSAAITVNFEYFEEPV